jgi:hypothetical protein
MVLIWFKLVREIEHDGWMCWRWWRLVLSLIMVDNEAMVVNNGGIMVMLWWWCLWWLKIEIGEWWWWLLMVLWRLKILIKVEVSWCWWIVKEVWLKKKGRCPCVAMLLFLFFGFSCVCRSPPFLC